MDASIFVHYIGVVGNKRLPCCFAVIMDEPPAGLNHTWYIPSFPRTAQWPSKDLLIEGRIEFSKAVILLSAHLLIIISNMHDKWYGYLLFSRFLIADRNFYIEHTSKFMINCCDIVAALLHLLIAMAECVSVTKRRVNVVLWYSRAPCWVLPMENLFLIGLVDDNRNFAAVSACS